MIQSIAFTMYPVTNMARSRKFYEEVLGLKVSSTFGEQWIEYDLGGNTFAITSMNIGRTPGAKGASVGFEVSDFEAFTKGLKEKSVKFILDNYETPVCRMSVIEDPDQNHITIHKLHKG
ncbi:MAG: VOC family protein [Candidatus Manganitrophus sp.]|nr:VOC family protein [Candidatus Manganitrophus sp.]WDT71777.1 MAG: VOC family protein [Candidatus Manganitrophus sp.]WDT80850.1 MAG: VOC family protein [Candidatus Manganitrophus sp.]